MTYSIEFVGAPGSGKSYIFKKILTDLKKQKKIKFFFPRDVLIKDFFKSSQNISYLKKIGYYFYFKKIKINSNKIFSEEFKKFINYIKRLIVIDKDIRIVLKIYKKYLSTTNYSSERKKRMSMNLLVDYFGTKINLKKENHILLDEGFFQKIYLNFFNKKNKISKNLLIKYLTKIPKPNLIIFVDTDIEICLKRTEKRKKGFLYNIKNRSYLNKKELFNNFILDFAKKNKIKIVKINNNIFNIKKYKTLFQDIHKKIKE